MSESTETHLRRIEQDGYTVLRLPVSRIPLWRTYADLRAIERAVFAKTGRTRQAQLASLLPIRPGIPDADE